MSDTEAAQQQEAAPAEPAEPVEAAEPAEATEPAAEAPKEAHQDVSLHVGNIRFETTEEQLREAFAPFGEVRQVRLIRRKDGRSRGYGFVDFANKEDAQKAIDGLHNKELDGRPITVELANDKERRSRDRDQDRRYRDRDHDRGYRDRDRGYRDDYRRDRDDYRRDRDRDYRRSDRDRRY